MPRQLGREQRASDRRAHRPAHDASHTHQGPESCSTRKEPPSDIAKGSAKDQHRSKNTADRKSVVLGKSGQVSVELGGRGSITTKTKRRTTDHNINTINAK